jgi:SAM-dependent methyltransferase
MTVNAESAARYHSDKVQVTLEVVQGDDMGFYSRVIFPRICDWLMNDPTMSALRSESLAPASGDVLEIGFGTGLNLRHYPKHIRAITTVDPNPGMERLARKRIVDSGIRVDQHQHSGEELPFPDASFDCVVSTWTMCSIPDADRAMRELYRVLKPGGRFIFLEHGLSDLPKVQSWQRGLNPLQRRIGDGCRLDLDVDAVVRRQPFAEVQLERFVMDRMPRTHGTVYRGTAIK